MFVLHLRLPLPQAAKTWQAANDAAYKGPAGNFSPGQDRRLLWASYEAQVGDNCLALAGRPAYATALQS